MILNKLFSPSKPISDVLFNFFDELGKYATLSEELKSAFIHSAVEVRLKKGSYLIREDEYCENIYFLVNGIISGSRYQGRKKIVTFITVSGEFISPIAGMYGLSPSGENFLGEEECYLIGIPCSDLLRFFDQHPEMNVIMRKILENHYKTAHERAVIQKMGTAKEKYAYYLNILPYHHNKVSTELAANFLGIKPQTLIKIRKATLEKNEDPNYSFSLIRSLKKLMKRDRVYQQPKISLQDLSRLLHTSPHQISSLINTHYGLNFTEFINDHRIQYVKEKLKNRSNFEQVTIESLGFEAGFSSKSTFFSVFRKHTGLSPLVYAKEG